MRNTFPIFIILLLSFLLLSLLVIGLKGLSQEKAVFRTRAQTTGGIDSIQQQVNLSGDGSVITIPKGTYSGGTAIPLNIGTGIAVSSDRGGSDTCFLRIENKKNLTIKGSGATLFGEGHDRPYEEPYYHRAGVCVVNSNVTFDGLHIKEFQRRCMVVYNSTIIYKNGTIDGCDEGGISMLGNSSALVINNNICCLNFGAVMLWQNAQAKIVNNIFHNTYIMFFYHPNSDDQARAEIINNVFSGGLGIVQVDWWKSEASKLKTNKVSYNLFSLDKTSCDPSIEICEFPGKITGDPLYIEPVVDPRGFAAWANFGFKEGSPAVGVGDPSIPGPKTLGPQGGPCADPNSEICSSFIKANTPKPYALPTPTPQEMVPPNIQEIIPPETIQTPIIPTRPKISTGPEKIISNRFLTSQTGLLFVENIGTGKTIRILGFYAPNVFHSEEKDLAQGESISYSYQNFCTGLSLRLNGGVLYRSSDDGYQTVRYKNLEFDCNKSIVLDIQ